MFYIGLTKTVLRTLFLLGIVNWVAPDAVPTLIYEFAEQVGRMSIKGG